MRKLIVILSLSIVLAAGCQKSKMENSFLPEGMTFKASTQLVKSHFDPDNMSDPALYWDEYDNLAVYAVNPENPAGSVVSGRADIQAEGVGQRTALFLSHKQESEWYKNASSSGSKKFFAYYPAEAPLPVEDIDGQLAINVFLESSQYRTSYGKQHLMISRGGEFSPGEQVVFSGFTPATALLRFQLKMDGGYDYNIQHILVEPYFYTEAGDYSTSIKVGSTTDPSTGEDKDIMEYVEKLVGIRYITLSSLLSDGALEWGRYDYSSQLDAANVVYDERYFPYEQQTLYVFSQDNRHTDTYSLTDQPGEYLYAAVFPTIQYPPVGQLALKVTAYYSVNIDNEHYGYGYSVMHEGFIRVPSPGLVAGKRYDFVLTLSQDELNAVLTNDGVDFSYDVQTW